MPERTVMPAAVLPPASFVEEVRAALDHLYDYAFLHNHPLARRLAEERSTDGVNPTQRVRTLLLDAIEQLRPTPRAGSAAAGDEMRAYAILTFRCLDGLSMDEIAVKLGLSRRQAYREYAKAVDAVTCIVWDALPSSPAPLPDDPSSAAPPNSPPLDALRNHPLPAAADSADPSRMNVAAEEVARLTSSLLLEPVDLPAVVHEVADLLAARLQQTGVALHVAEIPTQPLVAADRALLRQALLNFLLYALDRAGRDGAVEVVCTPAGRDVTLWLSTRRGHAEPAAKREGVGVAVAQKLVAAMGGQAQMEQAGAAWRCSLLLPLAARDTVLVVDDNEDLTALFQRYAAGHNLDVVGATSGVQALELVRELRPQLIVLDLMLAHMDGWEILQRLRRSEEAAATPIVICSVLNEPDLAFSMGASDYVTKPISQATLVDVLRRWLGRLPPAVSGSAAPR